MFRPTRRVAGTYLTILGIEGNTGLVQTGEQYKGLASGGLTVWNEAGQTRCTTGLLPAWADDL